MNIDSIKGAVFSKTMWFNGALVVLGGIDWITAHQSMISIALAALKVPAAGPALVVIGAVGVFLRAITSKPLADKAPAPDRMPERFE
jgi:hypothetical protein